MHFSYQDKLTLIAYTKQVSHGKYNPDTLTPLGVLDVIGRDRRYVCDAIYSINIICYDVLLSSAYTSIIETIALCLLVACEICMLRHNT